MAVFSFPNPEQSKGTVCRSKALDDPKYWIERIPFNSKSQRRSDDVDALIIPPDFADALASTMKAAMNFDACPDSYKRNVLRWIKLAKTEATRIQQAAEFAERNERIPQM